MEYIDRLDICSHSQSGFLVIGEHREGVSLAGFFIVFSRSVFFEAESLVGNSIPIFAH